MKKVSAFLRPMARPAMATLAVCTVAGATLVPVEANAFQLYDDEHFRLEIRAFGEVQYSAQREPEEGDIAQGTRINMARAQAVFTHKQIGGLMVQFEGRNQAAELIDMTASFTGVRKLELRGGYFRTGLHLEAQTPLPFILFNDRSSVVNNGVFRKWGAEALYMPTVEGTRLTFQAGLFNPTQNGETFDLGQLLMARASATFENGITVHLAATEHVFAANENPETGVPILAHDHLIDAAVAWQNDGWQAHVEGLTSVKTDSNAGELVMYSHVAHRFELPGPDIEPKLRFDYIDRDGVVTEQGYAGVNMYLAQDHNVIASLDYRGTDRDHALSHAVILTLQAGVW